MNRYDLSEWRNAPDDSTPVTAERLNAMNDGIKANNYEIIDLERGTKTVDKAVRLSRSDGTTYSVGSSNMPIYLNASGLPSLCTPGSAVVKGGQGIVSSDAVYKALTNGTVSKVGTATVGSSKKPIYLSGGVPTAMSENIGSASTPIYMKKGVITPSDANIGSATTPIYMQGGRLVPCNMADPITEIFQRITVIEDTLSGSITLPSSETKATLTLTSNVTFSNQKAAYILGLTAVSFSDDHHEFMISDYALSWASNKRVRAKLVLPTRAEIRGKKVTVTVKVSVLVFSNNPTGGTIVGDVGIL